VLQERAVLQFLYFLLILEAESLALAGTGAPEIASRTKMSTSRIFITNSHLIAKLIVINTM
jgi:hypothetical protein